MRMVGVPEASFEYWASKFLARGYKITRVDQIENKLDLEERRRSGKLAKKVFGSCMRVHVYLQQTLVVLP